MIVLVGESASGKSTVENLLRDKYGYTKTVSYTTREPRQNEIQGVDYNFITRDEFEKKHNDGFFAEVGSYNGWLYGTTKEQYTDNTVAVLTPHGLRQLKKIFQEKEISSFYINVPRRDRLIKILQRGDNIDEAIRRNQSDVGQYDGIEDEVSFVIKNDGYKKKPEDIVSEILLSIVGDAYDDADEKTLCDIYDKL